MQQKRPLVPWLVRIALTTSLLSASGYAHALGLGKLTLHSGLDEPLNADVELTTDNPDELKTLRAGLAPRSEFDAAGVDWMPLLASIKYNVVKQPSGGYVLHLSSDQPMSEPFLHFLLQADWTGGHLIHEYTALLDPPYMVAAKPAPVEAPQLAATPPATAAAPQVPPAPTATEGHPDAEIAAAQDNTPKAPAPAESKTAAAGNTDVPAAVATQSTAKTPESAEQSQTESPATGTAASDELLGPPTPESQVVVTAAPAEQQPRESAPSGQDWANTHAYGPVKKGDTLWKIAEGVRADKNISVEQVMIALLKANRSAFVRTNVNNLKTGKILTLPDRNQVETISKKDAAKQFHAQYDVWQEYKLRAAAARRAVTVADTGGKSTAKGAIATQPSADDVAKQAAPAPAAGGTDLLRIVRDNLANKSPGANGAGAGAAKQPGVAGEQQKLGDKVATLEEAITSRELENKELRERVAQLEKQLNATKRLVEIENSQLALAQKQASAPPPVQAQAPVVPPKPAAPAPAPAPAPAAPKAATPRPATPPHVAPAPTPKSDVQTLGFIQGLLDDPMTLALFGGLVVIAGGVFAIYYRRRRRSITEFEESILSGGGLNSEGTPVATGREGGEVSLLSEFSQGGMGNIHSDEVDPIAEADVYLAYDRHEQAEIILKEAVVKDPTRHELRQKLLEIYHQRNDLAAFETVAEELYAALEGKGGKVWDRVEDMGRKMNPNNPLFRGGAARSSAVASQGFEMTAPMAAADVSAIDFASPVTASEPTPAHSALSSDTISFDLDRPAESPTPAPSEVTFDLDLNDAAPRAPEASPYSVDMPMSSPDTDSSGAIDLDFGTSDSGALAEPAAPALDSGDFAAELGAIEFEATTDNGDIGITLETPADGGAGELEWNLETDASAVTDVTFDDSAAAEADTSFEGLVSSDEIATKLDLAKAYIDMGDADGARSILTEVAAEGNELQKKQAAELVAQIA